MTVNKKDSPATIPTLADAVVMEYDGEAKQKIDLRANQPFECGTYITNYPS